MMNKVCDLRKSPKGFRGFNGIRTRGLCVSAAVLYQPELWRAIYWRPANLLSSSTHERNETQNEMMWTAGIQMNWVCDHRSESQFKQLRKRPKKKDLGASTGFEPVASALALQCSTSLSYEDPYTGGRPIYCVHQPIIEGMKHRMKWCELREYKWIEHVTIAVNRNLSNCEKALGCRSRKPNPKNKPGIVIGWLLRFCFRLRLRQSSFHWIISVGVISGIGRKWNRFDSSDSDSVELMTPLTTTTPILDFQ